MVFEPSPDLYLFPSTSASTYSRLKQVNESEQSPESSRQLQASYPLLPPCSSNHSRQQQLRLPLFLVPVSINPTDVVVELLLRLADLVRPLIDRVGAEVLVWCRGGLKVFLELVQIGFGEFARSLMNGWMLPLILDVRRW